MYSFIIHIYSKKIGALFLLLPQHQTYTATKSKDQYKTAPGQSESYPKNLYSF